MDIRDINIRFKELIKDNKIKCVQEELDDFLMCGLIIQSGNKFYDRFSTPIDIEIIKAKQNNFNINLSNIINESIKLSKETGEKRIYCMTKVCYNKYKETNHIVIIKDKEYYTHCNEDYWLVNIV